MWEVRMWKSDLGCIAVVTISNNRDFEFGYINSIISIDIVILRV